MVRFTSFLIGALAVLGTQASNSAVLDLTPKNFDSVVLKSGKPTLAEFFAPWCGHCKTLAPIYEELAQHFAHSDKVQIAKIDADDHKNLGKRFGVQGFPTLKWFDGKSDVPIDYSGGRDLESLIKFITEKTGVKSKAKKAAPSHVQWLSDSLFKEKVGGEQDVLVAFTTGWCGHCKALAPTWESLASDFASEPSVLIAKVDAEAENSKALAEEQGVQSYPTIKYFPKGSKEAQDYEGGRTEKDFVEFMNVNAGTHRMVGGGLDAKAGTIDALDTIIAKYTTGGSLKDVTAEVAKAVQSLKDTYSAYYVKVLDKLGKSDNYATKELARLEGLLKKGGLAPEKIDDFTSRSNILRKFIPAQDETKQEL